MATYNKFNQTVEDLGNGVHDLAADQLVVALTNTLPVAANSVLADLTEIAYTNLSTRNITTTSATQTAGTYRPILVDLTLTASGGAVAGFRYVVVYNDTPTSPADPLIAFYDYGSTVTMQDGETFLIDFDGVNGLFGLA
jgi:hypothetical protein